MKLKLLIVISNDKDCADLDYHLGAKVEPHVRYYEREVEIPELEKGWDIRLISRRVKSEAHDG